VNTVAFLCLVIKSYIWSINTLLRILELFLILILKHIGSSLKSMLVAAAADSIGPCEAPPDGNIALTEVKKRIGDQRCILENISIETPRNRKQTWNSIKSKELYGGG
jgi:hypothetical protein